MRAREKVRRGQEQLAALEALDVQFLVLDAHRDRGLIQAALANSGWVVDFEDQESVLFARTRSQAGIRSAAA